MKAPIIILHGWGLFGDRYQEVKKLLEKSGYNVYSPDLPGFGKEKLIKEAMCLDDYVNFVKKYLNKNKLKKVILIGHSFGGRIASKFSVKYPALVEKLILTGAPVVKVELSFKKKIINKIVLKGEIFVHLMPNVIYEILRKVIYRFIGEWDYYKAKKLKKTFLNILNEHLDETIKNIKIPTLLLWGENDKFISVEYAKKAHQLIKNSKLEIVEGFGHGLPYTNPSKFSKIVLSFIQK